MTTVCAQGGVLVEAATIAREFINEAAFYKEKQHYVRAVSLLSSTALLQDVPSVRQVLCRGGELLIHTFIHTASLLLISSAPTIFGF
jgi:hypothetical protein